VHAISAHEEDIANLAVLHALVEFLQVPRVTRHQAHTDLEILRGGFLGQLEHPSIVPVYDIDERSDGATLFTMRRVLGKTLHSILDDLRRGDPAARARYTQRELLTAFATDA